MRYCYHNKMYLASGAAHGILADPVKRGGKCVVGPGRQLVRFEDGTEAVVIRRALRLRHKCKCHKELTCRNQTARHSER